jgi:hypothetical protein|nr:hypothetical protein [Panacagrimonas sp.]
MDKAIYVTIGTPFVTVCRERVGPSHVIRITPAGRKARHMEKFSRASVSRPDAGAAFYGHSREITMKKYLFAAALVLPMSAFAADGGAVLGGAIGGGAGAAVGSHIGGTQGAIIGGAIGGAAGAAVGSDDDDKGRTKVIHHHHDDHHHHDHPPGKAKGHYKRKHRD